MKLIKHSWPLLFVILLSATPARSQHYVGVIGGVNYANLNIDLEPPDDDFDRLTRFGLGVVVGLNLHKNLTLHFEPMYLRKGGKQSDFDLELGNAEFIFKTATIEVPVFLKVGIDSRVLRPYLLAGPIFGFILDTSLEVEAAGLEFKGDADQIVKTVEFGLGFGGGLDLSVGKHTIFLEGRYTFGLNNINKGGTVPVQAGSVSETIEIDGTSVKTTGLQIMTGFAFSI